MSQYTKIYDFVIDRGYHSISNFCNEFGINKTSFSDLKSGRIKSLSPKNLQKVADALNVKVDDLLNDNTDESLLNFTYADFVSMCNEKNISTAKLSQKAKISNTILLRWKNGETDPQLPTRYKILEALNNLPSVNKNANTSFPVNDSAISTIPIYGKIPAGPPVLAQQDIIGYGLSDKPNPDEYFFLTVDGDSMEPLIPNHTKVLIKKQNTADDGDVIACIVNGEEATLKRIKYFGKNTILLMPENNKYEPITLKTDDFENGTNLILGVVKQCVKDF